MANIANLLTEHMPIWTAAYTEKKSGRGKASDNSGSVYGVKKLRELIYELASIGVLVDGEFNCNLKLLGEVSEFVMGQAPPGSECNFQAVGEPFVKTGEFGELYPEIREWTTKPLKFAKKGDILICVVGATIGKLNLGIDCSIGRSVAAIRPTEEIDTKYLYYTLMPFTIKLRQKSRGSAQGVIGKSELSAVKIRVPPLAEQHRIVSKVDELMALCDQLEQQYSSAQEAHETLVSQLLATLTQNQNAAEFNANWQRIYAHFDVLFTTEASIDDLKQTLLQLAVMGKLVPQDPSDEPASALLKRIQAEKTKLIAEGKLKKEKPLVPIGEDEKPFELPKGWEWWRLASIGITSTGGTPKTSDTHFFGGIIPFIGPGQISLSGELLDSEKYLTEDGVAQSTLAESGDILMVCIGGSIGKTLLVNERLTFNQQINCVKPVLVNSSYLICMMNSTMFQQKLLLNATGSATPIINRSKWDELLVALAPLQEQHRIVAKVDALMSLCDQLKTRIQQANQQQQAIADGLVAQALKPATAEIIDLAAYRAAITCNIIKRMQHNQAFGRTFAMKLLYLSQQHIGFETHLEFEREAAGPFDKWIYNFERDGIAAGWFGLIEKPLSSGYTKIEYQLMSAIDEPISQMNAVGTRKQRNELERLFALFADKKTEEAEITATLFAVWNDFLLNGLSPTDEEIIQEVRENWHSSKARFSPEQLTKWLSWLRDNNIVPTGKGSKTIYQKQLIN